MSSDRDAARRRAQFEQMKSHPGVGQRTKIRLWVVGISAALFLIAVAAQSMPLVIIAAVAVSLGWRIAARF